MKPFNLEAALRGEPVCHKDGRRALAVRHIPELNEDYRVLVAWKTHAPVSHYTEDGKSDMFYPDPLLFMAPRKRKGWLHLMRGVSGMLYACYTSEESERASTQESDNHVATVPVEWEE